MKRYLSSEESYLVFYIERYYNKDYEPHSLTLGAISRDVE